MDKNNEVKLMKQMRVAERLDVRRTTLWSLRRDDPDFPRPVRVGKSVAWRSDEIEDYIRSRSRG